MSPFSEMTWIQLLDASFVFLSRFRKQQKISPKQYGINRLILIYIHTTFITAQGLKRGGKS